MWYVSSRTPGLCTSDTAHKLIAYIKVTGKSITYICFLCIQMCRTVVLALYPFVVIHSTKLSKKYL